MKIVCISKLFKDKHDKRKIRMLIQQSWMNMMNDAGNFLSKLKHIFSTENIV